MGVATAVNHSERSRGAKSQNGMPIANADVANVQMLFTGERRNDHFRIFLNGEGADLTNCTLNAVLNLVVARAQLGSGFLHVSRITICRLRQVINAVMGDGAGEALIETGCREEYRLALTREQVIDQVSFTPCFFELEEMRVLSKDQSEAIRRSFPMTPIQPIVCDSSFVQEG